jgi:Flp pilus assembly protein TadD
MSNWPVRCDAWFGTACALALFAVLSTAATETSAAEVAPAVACTPLGVGDQLIDYNDPAMAARLQIVEAYHFNSDVRSLRKGQSSTVAGDLDFVLRAVPNHYPALAAMGRWQATNGAPKAADGHAEPAQCYFERAIRFRPTDAQLRVAYGVFLHQTRQLDAAQREYEAAEAMGGGGAELYYNMGLLLLDRGDIERAQQYADKAYELGYPLPGLKNKLKKARAR